NPLVEEAVASHAEPLEAGHTGRDLEGREAIDAWRLPPNRLARHVVGQFVLEENVRPAVPVPDHVVLLVVLDEAAVGGPVVAVDEQAGIGRVGRPADPGAMIGPP